MKIQKVASRGFLFTFDDPYKTNVYVINGNKHIFVCDTFLGPDPMEKVLTYLEKNGVKRKPFIAFNSHYDYDHYWGNQCFKDSIILAHEQCIINMEMEAESDLKEFDAHKKGDIELTFPNTLFHKKISFVDDVVEFYHTPGHTSDSSSCYDYYDQVLFVGDNIETPLPYLRIHNLDDYANTLREYLTGDVKFIISGHDDLMENKELVKSNLKYLESFGLGRIDKPSFSKKERGIHYINLSTMGDYFKNNDNKEEALKYYKEAEEILQESDETERIVELRKKISEKIKELE